MAYATSVATLKVGIGPECWTLEGTSEQVAEGERAIREVMSGLTTASYGKRGNYAHRYTKDQYAAARRWAAGEGIELKAKGPVPHRVMDRFLAAVEGTGPEGT